MKFINTVHSLSLQSLLPLKKKIMLDFSSGKEDQDDLERTVSLGERPLCTMSVSFLVPHKAVTQRPKLQVHAMHHEVILIIH
jgi:hypothetical protein